MVQTIRIFRKKEDDVLVLYLIEFFKFIGCIVCDCEMRKGSFLSLRKEDVYVCNILINVDENELPQGVETGGKLVIIKGIDMKKFSKSELLDCMSGGEESFQQFLQGCIDDIWENDDTKVDITFLKRVYSENHLFFYLYNEGLRKYIQRQHSSPYARKSLDSALEQTAQWSFEYFAKAYNQVCTRNTDERALYWQYAEALLMYKLNQKSNDIGRGGIFKTETLLNKIEDMEKKNPEFIRAKYLGGSICKDLSLYGRIAEGYFIEALELIEQKKVNGLNAFIYYRLGKLEEEKRGDLKLAEMCYKGSLDFNFQYYQTILKMINRNDRERAIEQCNEVIRITLNGYEMKEVMPKQQVYAYDAFKILGDIFQESYAYEAAKQSYENALEIAKEKSLFFDNFNADQQEVIKRFSEIVVASMPVQPILYNLMECASKIGDMESRNKYMDEYVREL